MGSDPAGLTPWHNLQVRPFNLIWRAIFLRLLSFGL